MTNDEKEKLMQVRYILASGPCFCGQMAPGHCSSCKAIALLDQVITASERSLA